MQEYQSPIINELGEVRDFYNRTDSRLRALNALLNGAVFDERVCQQAAAMADVLTSISSYQKILEARTEARISTF